jgi:DNA-directed RNA polymerase subunit RPC12/RpoP
MKFLCLDCDQPMKLHGTEGPDEGSLSITFRCPECGFRVAMLTNQFETQMVRSLGVKIGGRPTPPAPFEHLRTAMADPRPDAFEAGPATPEFIRPMARRAIERFAETKGYGTVTEAVMDEARGVFGM